MPCVASLDAFHRAVDEFVVEDLGLVIEPAALAAAGRSLDACGLLLLGEMHGARENPLLIRALMQAFGLTSLALEWPDDLTPMVRAFLAGEPLADHPWLWGGDGRITAGHLAVLAERSKAGPLEVILFDGIMGAGWSWSQRDEAMARRLLAGSPAGARTLAVAGNAHTPTSRTDLGVPLGACLARQRPGIREIQIRYGGGRFWNFESCQFAARAGAQGPVRLYEDTGELILDLPIATEAIVPQRPQSSPYDPPAVPAVYLGTEGRPGPVLFTLDVDGERFAIRRAGDGTVYDWLSGPNKGYGFGSSGTPDRPAEEHLESIRAFLAMIDPDTGYIGDD